MRVAIYLLLLLLAAGSALYRGTRGERWIGFTVLAGNLLSYLVEQTLARSFGSVSFIYLSVDAALAMALCVIAVGYPSWLSILVAAFQVNGTLGHVVKLVAPQTIPFSYAFLLRFWAWPMVLAMLAGRLLPRLRTILTVRTFAHMPIGRRRAGPW